jgi:hypothetical protein
MSLLTTIVISVKYGTLNLMVAKCQDVTNCAKERRKKNALGGHFGEVCPSLQRKVRKITRVKANTFALEANLIKRQRHGAKIGHTAEQGFIRVDQGQKVAWKSIGVTHKSGQLPLIHFFFFLEKN